jgi:hypothetical protein
MPKSQVGMTHKLKSNSKIQWTEWGPLRLQMNRNPVSLVTFSGRLTLEFTFSNTFSTSGPSSNIAFIGQITHAMATAVNTDPTRPLPVDAKMEGAMMSISRPASPIAGAQSLDQSLSAAVDVYSLPPEADMLHLIRLFFADTGMLFPYVHEGSLLQEFAVAKQNNFTSIRRSWLCLLNMILTFATCVSARPDLPVERNAVESDVFFKRAQALSGKMAFRTANVEIGKNDWIRERHQLTRYSPISIINDAISSRNTALCSDVESSWPHGEGSTPIGTPYL